jgi:hypothetical protein
MALTPGKAKKMLSDGTVHGRGLTDKQKKYFGAIAGGATPMKKINGGWLDKYQEGGTIKVNSKNDPRYKAYQDSLRAYNLNPVVGQKMLEWELAYNKTFKSGELVDHGPIAIESEAGSSGPATEKFNDVHERWMKWTKETQGKLEKETGIRPDRSVQNPNYIPRSILRDMLREDSEREDIPENVHQFIYKKPTQPVEIERLKPVSSLNSSGITPINVSNSIEASQINIPQIATSYEAIISPDENMANPNPSWMSKEINVEGDKKRMEELLKMYGNSRSRDIQINPKYKMGGSLPGASGMMYSRSNTPPPLYTQSEMKAKSGGRCWSGYKAVAGKTPFSKDSCKKAQDGREIAIDNTAVRSIRIPIIDKTKLKKFPNEIPVVQKTPPMFSQDNRTSEQRKIDRAYTNEMNSPILPTGAMPLTYLSNPFRLIGDIYNSTIQPLATNIFSTSTLQPLTGDLLTSDEVARKLNSRRVRRERGQISRGEQMYGNLMQGLPETGWAAANVFGGPIIKGGLKYGKQFLNKFLPSKNTLQNIYRYYKNPLGDAFKIGNNNPNIPTFLTRGQNPPNPLRGNSKIDANNFMQSWTNPNNPSFVSKFDDQIMKPFSTGAMNENYLRVQTRELNVLKQQLDDFVKETGNSVLPKAKALQKSITQLENNINGFYKIQYSELARNNMKAIQAGEFNTVYSTTGYLPGSGGTYYIPYSSQPMNNWKYMYPNQPNKMGIGNNSVVKLREVPVGANNAVRNTARTEEMLTGIHETLGHASNVGGTALTKQTNDLIKNALKPNPKIKEGTSKYLQKFIGRPDATYKDWAKYLQDPTEMIARVMELRRQYINPTYWGTSKQYNIPDKLIDRIFRDGLSGKSKVNADFFRVIDKKGLKKLMKGLYATIPMAIGADGLLEYKHGGNVPKAQGGWLDNYEVIEDDMGQLTNPGKITKINSNNITMKGVNYPVLGVSDTGDTKVMQPGKDYKFGGNSVTEYPMAQDGLTTKTPTPSFPYINRVPDTSPQVDFLKDWTNSPRGQELLSKSFDGDEKDIEKLTYKRINNLDKVDFSIDDHASDFLGRYNRNRHDIKLNSSLLDTSEPKLIGNQDKDVVLHELSHAQDFSPGAEFNRITIPLSDQKLINKYRKRTIKDTKKLDAPRKVRKDIKDRVNYIGDPTETRARLNSIRYFYETSPIGKEEGMPSIFDSEVTSDMMEVMKDNQQFRELQEVYNDEEILELLNTVSDNSKSSGPSNMAYAQEGNNIPLKTVNEFGELERLTYPSSVFKDKEGNPQQVSLLDEVVVTSKGPITSAKEQMKEYGITDELRKSYVKDKSERAYNNIVPQGYGNIKTSLDRYRRFKGNLGRDPEALWYDGPEDDKTHYTIPNRDDAFRLYLGMPQINNSFSVSDYRPGDSEDKSMVYLKPTYFQNPEIRQELLDDYFRKYNSGIDEKYGLGFQDKRGIGNERQLSRGEWQGDGTPFPSADNALGDFTFDMGEDDKGSYISIYDIWDLQPFSSTGEGSSLNRAGKALLNLFNKKSGKKATSESEASELFGAGKPFEVYERIYFDPKTKKIIDMKQGGSLEKKAQLTNFTNYNTPQPGGWLDKY